MLDLGVDVTFAIAFASGFASFMSPCLLPMIPAYILFMAGSSLEEEMTLKQKRLFQKRALVRTLAFIAGFTFIFMLLGLSASAAGQFFTTYKALFQRIGGVIIVLLGLQFLGVFKNNLLSKSIKGIRLPFKENSLWGALLMGLAFGTGWTPCFGPVLAAIIVMASNSESITQGTFLLMTYALGLGIPFLLTAIFINEISPLIAKWEKIAKWIGLIAGLFLIFFGILMAMDWLVQLNYLF